MWNLELLARNVKKLNEDKAFQKVIRTPAIQVEAIRLNRDEQLFQKGVDNQGNKMRSDYARFGNFYSNYTIAIKNEKNQPTDRVTLRDTGAMYKTFKTKIVGDDLMLDVNSIKEGQDLIDSFGQFAGLDQQSISKLLIVAKPIVYKYVYSTVLQ
jgi:hypothetical protein